MAEWYEEMYPEKRTIGTTPIYRWYHKNRKSKIVDLIEGGGGRVASIACGEGHLESTYLSEIFDEVVGVDFDHEKCVKANSDIPTLRASGDVLPLKCSSFDAVVSLSSVEHFPDEEAFLEEVVRILRPDGSLYINFPIEVGVGGLIRYLGKNIIYPEYSTTPNNWRRFTDYTWGELTKQVPRDKHGTSHRYYNYTYAIDDLSRMYDEIDVIPWPFEWAKSLNIGIFVHAKGPIDQS